MYLFQLECCSPRSAAGTIFTERIFMDVHKSRKGVLQSESINIDIVCRQGQAV